MRITTEISEEGDIDWAPFTLYDVVLEVVLETPLKTDFPPASQTSRTVLK